MPHTDIRERTLPRRMAIDTATRRWIEQAVDRVAEIGEIRRLPGGVGSITQEVVVNTPRQRHLVILRRMPPPIPAREARRLAHAEATALQRIEGPRVVPRLLAVDETGAITGVPATLQTRLRGRPDVAPRDPGVWARRLAAQIAAQRSWSIPRAGLRAYRPWLGDDPAPHVPDWSPSPARWRRAHEVALAVASAPHPDQGLLHRDFHPGNILFDHGHVSGVIDWSEQCRGPVEVDVSRCRVEVALLKGRRLADRFLADAEELLDLDYDPSWDLVVACELVPAVDDLLEFDRVGAAVTARQLRTRLDDVVQRALDQLGMR